MCKDLIVQHSRPRISADYHLALSHVGLVLNYIYCLFWHQPCVYDHLGFSLFVCLGGNETDGRADRSRSGWDRNQFAHTGKELDFIRSLLMLYQCPCCIDLRSEIKVFHNIRRVQALCLRVLSQ